MSWSQTSPMDQRTQFIADYLREVLSVTELSDLYGISRKTAYKWIERYLRQGPAGLEEHSRRPQSSPYRTSDEVSQALLEARRRHRSWGAKKLLTLVHQRHPKWDLPHRSTVCDILKRHGMVPKQRNRRHIGHPGKPSSQILAPNDCWSADFKGQFKTGNGLYCYPLTVTDNFSRYLLECQALNSTSVEQAKPVFTRLFKEYGLPQRIRTDNGVPFATNTLARLSQLSAWWVRLGVMPELIEPGASRSKTAATSACTARSRMKRRVRPLAVLPPSSASSTCSSMSSTMNARTKRSTCKHRLPVTSPVQGKCRTRSRLSSTPIASRSAM